MDTLEEINNDYIGIHDAYTSYEHLRSDMSHIKEESVYDDGIICVVRNIYLAHEHGIILCDYDVYEYHKGSKKLEHTTELSVYGYEEHYKQ